MYADAGVARLVLLALMLASRPAAAIPACPKGGAGEPSGRALALKNAAQDFRESEAWVEAARSFRNAADALPACETFDDERLRWSLWAVEALEKAGSPTAERSAMSDFLARQLAVLEDHETGRSLPDLPQLQAAHEQLRPAATSRDDAPAEATRSRRATTGIALLGVGSGVLVASVALLAPFSLRNARLDGELNGRNGVYMQMLVAGCGLSPAADHVGSNLAACNQLRNEREDILDRGKVSNGIVLGTAVTATVGGLVALTGVVLFLRERNRTRETARSTVSVTPTWGGVLVQGRF